VSRGKGKANLPEGFKVVHGQGISLCENSTYELGQNVKGHLDTGHGFDHPDRNDKDKGEQDTIRYSRCRGVGRPGAYAGETAASSDEKHGEVPPLRDLKRSVRALHTRTVALYSPSGYVSRIYQLSECIEGY
jgi:hypothetical protein